MTAQSKQHTLPEQIGLREVLRLSWPIMVSMLSFTAMIVTDSIFVSHLGTAALAAIAFSTAVTYLLFSFALGLIRGAKIVVSQRTGAGDEEGVQRAFWQALWLAGGLGITVAALAPLGRPIFQLLGGSEEVIALAVAYYAVRLVGAPISFTQFGINAWLEGRGDTRTPMVAMLIANGLNIALDPILIFGWGPVPAMGIGGAAAATVLAVACSLVFLVWRVVVTRAGAGVSRRPNRRLMSAIWRMGMPLGLRQLLEVGAFTAFVALLGRAGEAHLAAHVVVMRIVSVSFLPGYAIGEAGSILVGQAVGAGRPELARQAFRASLRMAVLLMAAMAFVFVGMPEPLIAVFKASPEVVEVARVLLIVAAMFQVFDALATVGMCTLTGAGDTRFVMVCGVTAGWFVNLPVAWLFAVQFGWGAPGAWLALTLEIAALAAVFGWRIRGSRWLEVGALEVAAQGQPEGRVDGDGDGDGDKDGELVDGDGDGDEGDGDGDEGDDEAAA